MIVDNFVENNSWHLFQVDITNYERIEEVKKKINAEMGVVDILVNNAGLMPRNSFRDGDYRAVQRVMDVNVMSHFWVKLETSNISG